MGDRSMDAAPPAVAAEPEAKDWSLLPLDVLSSVFARLGAIDVLMGAGLVCRSWLDAAKVPHVWRVVEMYDDEIVEMDDDDMDDNTIAIKKHPDMLRGMAKAAVRRSDGQLRVFAGKNFVTEELLTYIVERSPLLTTLRLAFCGSTLFSARVADIIKESPLLELRSLELNYVDITVKKLTAVLENCPALEVLVVRYCYGMFEEDERVLRAKFARIRNLTFECDDDEDIDGCYCVGFDC